MYFEDFAQNISWRRPIFWSNDPLNQTCFVRNFFYLSFSPFFKKGGASDDFAKAKAHIPFAVTLELPPTHSYER